jgi:organic radical activating enzyme
MNIAIRSSGEHAKKLYRMLQQNDFFNVICFVEEINKITDNEELEVMVVSQYEALELYKCNKIEKILVPGTLSVGTLRIISNELSDMGWDNRDVIYVPISVINETKSGDLIDVERILNSNSINALHYLEYHVTNECNMKCANCDHNSQYIKSGESNIVYDDVKRDLLRLREIVPHIEKIRIMGGECLLNPQLEEYIKMTRSIYKYSDLRIVSNGLLIRTMKESLIQTIIDNDVTVDISAYKPIWKNLDEIVSFLKKYNVKYTITPPIAYFSKTLDLNNKVDFPYKNLIGVPNCDCHNLYKGMLSPCSSIAYFDIYNEYNKCGKEVDDMCGRIDIYDKNLNFDELYKKIISPSKLCDYCVEYRSIRNRTDREVWHRFNQ